MEEKEIFEDEIEYSNAFKPKEVHLKENYVFYRRNILYRIWNKIVVFGVAFVFGFPKILQYGFKTTGRKNLRKVKGAIVISNHVWSTDVILTLSALRHRLIYATTLQSNLGFPVVSKIFTGGGAVPIPSENLRLMRNYKNATIKTLNDGYNIIFYPEGHLVVKCKRVRPFLSGAFHYAYDSNNKVIVPTVMTFHKPKGIYKLLRGKKPCIHFNILKPYYIKDMGTKKSSITKAMDDLYNIMNDYYKENSDYFN